VLRTKQSADQQQT